MKRTWIAAWASLSVVALACTFPDVTFGPGVPADDAGAGDASVDAEIDAAAEPLLLDGGSPDALIAKDAGGRISPDACAPNDCDCDRDGYMDLAKTGCADAGGPADCDDLDSRTHPNTKAADDLYLEDAPEPEQYGDWNCNGTVEKLFPENVKCAGLPLVGCKDVVGFEGAPGCGNPGKLIQCQKGGFGGTQCLSVDTNQVRPQACR